MSSETSETPPGPHQVRDRRSFDAVEGKVREPGNLYVVPRKKKMLAGNFFISMKIFACIFKTTYENSFVSWSWSPLSTGISCHTRILTAHADILSRDRAPTCPIFPIFSYKK